MSNLKMEKGELSRVPKRGKVAIIGTDTISAADIYSLLVRGFVSELVLVGERSGELIVELGSLQRFVAFPKPVSIRSASYEDAARADIVVLQPSSDRGSETTLLAFVKASGIRVRETAAKLRENDFHGIALVTVGLVDVNAHAALNELGCEPGCVIGLGAGLRDVAPDHGLQEPVLPAHDTNCLTPGSLVGTAAWCTAQVAQATFMDSCTPDCPHFDRVLSRGGAGCDPGAGSAAAHGAMLAACVTQVCEAVILDTKQVIPVFTSFDPQTGQQGTFTNRPCVIGACGVEAVVDLSRSDNERLQRVQDAESFAQVTGTNTIPAAFKAA